MIFKIVNVTNETVSIAEVDFKGEVVTTTNEFPAIGFVDAYHPKKGYKEPEFLKTEDMSPGDCDKYLLGVAEGHLASAMEVLRIEFPTPSVHVRTTGSKVFALEEYAAGELRLLPLTQCIKEVKEKQTSPWHCSIGGKAYSLSKPSGYSPPAWFVRSVDDKKNEVNMKLVKKTVTLSAKSDERKDTMKCVIPILVNTRKVVYGTELVMFKEATEKPATETKRKFAQI